VFYPFALVCGLPQAIIHLMVYNSEGGMEGGKEGGREGRERGREGGREG